MEPSKVESLTIIAMKGPSTNKKSEIARQLSAYLQYPLIDEQDIISVLENTITKPFIDTTSNDLAFKIITKIASTQLNSKLKVIINTSLSENNELLQLVHLATSENSSLIIVECLNQDNAQVSDVYDMGKLPNLNINMEKAFIVEDFASKLLDFAKSYQKVDLEAIEHKETKGSSSTELSLIDEKIRTQWHAHEFSIFSDTNVTRFEKFSCNYCEKSISGATYKCLECDEFIIHKECAEFSGKSLNDHLEDVFPHYFYIHSPDYEFPSKQKCKLCDEFSISCPNCIFQTHIGSKLLPTILKYEEHEHPLNFVIMPSWVNFAYKCSKCDELGNSISYKCYNCCFDVHLNCALPPPKHAPLMIVPTRHVDSNRNRNSNYIVIGRNDLKSMPHQLQGLTAFEILYIDGFDEVEVLSEWLGNLSSLLFLYISKCKNLKHLPSATAVKSLSKLKELHIKDCPLLKEIYKKKSDSEWSKISHIPEIYIDGFHILRIVRA